MSKIKCWKKMEGDSGPLFVYDFGSEPQTGDFIVMSQDELEGIQLDKSYWIERRFFVKGVLNLQVSRYHASGIVPA